jgi:hypothetical protein
VVPNVSITDQERAAALVHAPAAPFHRSTQVAPLAVPTPQPPSPAGMPADQTSTSVERLLSAADLAVAWQAWCDVLEAIRAGQAPALSEAGYQDLHCRLLTACQARAEAAAAETQALWRQLADLVQPWLSLQALTATDAETLGQLCRRLQRLGPALGLDQGKTWPVVAIVALVFVASAAGWLLAGSGVRTADLGAMDGWAWAQRHPLVVLGVAIPAVLGTTLLLLKRLLRA